MVMTMVMVMVRDGDGDNDDDDDDADGDGDGDGDAGHDEEHGLITSTTSTFCLNNLLLTGWLLTMCQCAIEPWVAW